MPETRPADPAGASGAAARPAAAAAPPGAKAFIEQAKKRLSKEEYGQVRACAQLRRALF